MKDCDIPMTTSYNIKGLDCASCGLKIEHAIKKLPGVTHAVVDFANLRLHLEAADPAGCIRCNQANRTYGRDLAR